MRPLPEVRGSTVAAEGKGDPAIRRVLPRGPQETRGNSRDRRSQILTNVSLLYVHLWVLEGAFRKWVPGLDDVFYVARDGLLVVCLLLVAMQYPAKEGRAKGTIFWTAVWAFGMFVGVQVMVEILDPIVAIAGLRNYIAPLLLIYVVWRNQLADFWSRATWILIIYAPIQAAIVVVQVLTPTSSYINAQVGGTEATFTTSGGIVRAAGTFSSALGLTTFVTLALAISLGVVMSGERGKRLAGAVVALFSCFLAIALGGSRGAILNAAIVIIAILLQQVFAGRRASFSRTLGVGALLLAGWTFVNITLTQVLVAFGTRFENASRSEDPLQRILVQTFGALAEQPRLLGEGAGAHSAFGINLGSAVPWVEDDYVRWVVELGLLGYILVFARLILAIAILATMIARVGQLHPVQVGTMTVLLMTLAFGSITSLPTTQGLFGICCAILISMSTDRSSVSTWGVDPEPKELSMDVRRH
ncbi:hypothetical protein HDC94_002831 [Leifsonia sp. AK011]|uniref:O-antigen ligase family protein n=1 Tax=Leifsonia sp. AK011 TaxID=2723075 RepID=UPI0015C75D2E|nr:hypothetical protein [Leifsonia sp. AK011]NYF11675.1 hypothetical protein [Leifsonia sp. AK011]